MMENTKSYSTQDIEELKEKIAIYRDNLIMLKTGLSVEEHLSVKDEVIDFKAQVFSLENLVATKDDKQNKRLKENEKQIKHLSTDIEVLRKMIEALNLEDQNDEESTKDFNVSTEVKDFLNTDTIIDNSESTSTKNDEKEIDSTPSYSQIKDFAGSINRPIIPNDVTSIPIIDLQNQPSVNPHAIKPTFPYINNQPSQLNNRLYRHTNLNYTAKFKISNINVAIPAHVDQKADNLHFPQLEKSNEPEELNDSNGSKNDTIQDETNEKDLFTFFNIFKKRK